MKLEIKNEKKNEMEFVVEGEDHGFANLLTSELLKNEDVDIAQYDIPHPLTGNPVFYLRTKKGAPRTVLKKTIKLIKKEIKDMQ